MPTPAPQPTQEERVRARAYQIWLEEGRPEGRADIHWQRAVESLAAEAIPEIAPAVTPLAAAAPSRKKAALKTSPARKAPARKK